MIGIDINLVDSPERGQVVLERLRKTFPGKQSTINAILHPQSAPGSFIDLNLSESQQKFCLVVSDIPVDVELGVVGNTFTFRGKILIMEMPFTSVRVTNFNVGALATIRLVFG